CTTDTCDAGICRNGVVSGCTPCTTASQCNDFNPSTIDACTAGMCTHTMAAPEVTPAATEICGNCIDDDGNGLTDFEDPACCQESRTFAMTVEGGSMSARGTATALQLRTMLADSGLTMDPVAEDIVLQIRPENGTEVLCARIPAGSFLEHRRTFDFD